jgi:hypothetical protein
MDVAARRFAYDYLAQYLHEGPYDPASGLRTGLTRSHPSSVNLGKTQRLGGMGDKLHMALISRSHTVLKADIIPAKPVPDSLELKPQSWRSNTAWRAEILASPPTEPYMVVVFDKSTGYLDGLRLSSADTLVECGPKIRRYNLRPIHAALADFPGPDLDLILAAKKLVYRRLSEPNARLRIDSEINRLISKFPGLFDALERVPDYGAAEYDALSMIVNVRKFAENLKAQTS